MISKIKKEGLVFSSDSIYINDIKEILSEIKEEFEDHLTAINENTNEIQANYEASCELDSRIDKLSERLDRIELFLKEFGFEAKENINYYVRNLNKKEQEVFLILYTHEEKGPVTYAEIARKLGLTEELVCSYIQSMSAKGVPIHKKYINNKAFVRLDKKFKDLQTKKNILNIPQTIIPNILAKNN